MTKIKRILKSDILFTQLFLSLGLTFVSLFICSDTFAAPTRPECSDLNYNLPLTESWKCYDKYFTCPLNPNFIKCDRMAKVGDIKYSKATKNQDGWLLCDGSGYDKAKYTKLYNIISNKFGGTTSAPKLPDYRGVYLVGDNKEEFNKLIPSTIRTHYHKHKECSFSTITKNNNDQNDSITVIVEGFEDIYSQYGGSGASSCPQSVGLNPFIYAGEPTKQ